MRFRPEATGYNTFRYDNGEEELYSVCGPTQYPTYVELKQEIDDWLRTNCQVVKVIRSRRGQWGEWCETWKLVDGKPTIVNETWM